MDVIEPTQNELILAPRDVMTARNVPLLLTQPSRQRKSSVVVRYTRVERWDVIDDVRTVWKRRAQFALAMAGGIGIGVAAMAGFAGKPATPADASVAVSAPVAATPAPAAAARVPIIRKAAVAPTVIAAAPVATVASATSSPAVGLGLPDSEAGALSQAFSRNEAVSWRNATTTGTVVVGAANIDAGKYCRDVAILTRSDNAADRTINSRKCLEPGGRISDQAPPVPQ